MIKKVPAVLLILFSYLYSNAQTIYVATNGNDNFNGSFKTPVASFFKAQQLARTLTSKKTVHIVFKPGIYYLPQTIQFTTQDNKPEGIVFEAQKEGTVVISGGKKLQLKWKLYKNSIYVANIPPTASIDQLFVNEKRQSMARFPNMQKGKSVFDAWDLSHTVQKDSLKDVLLPSRIKTWQNPTGGYLHAMHNFLWGDMHWLIKGKNEEEQLILEGGWQNNRPSKMHPTYKMVEHIMEELDAPGEWFYNKTQHQLYFYPQKDVNLSNATIEIVTLKHLIELNGTEENPVKNIHFNGLVFKHAARTFMDNKEPLQRSDWTVYRGGALLFNGAENCSIQNSEFSYVGGNSILVNKYNKNITIKSCYIHHSGASGIVFVGDSAAVRSPIYGYKKQNYLTLDTIKGAKNNNYPTNCLVEDCIITRTGRDEKQTAGIQISVAANIRVNHCSIYDMPRAGINISEGNFGGHIIENSDIFNTVLETGDHGSFNSWGRDRFWTIDVKEVAKQVEKHPNLFLLDMIAPNIIRNNRWRCDFGWDIDLDDGSSHYRIYNNLLLNRGLKLREGYDRIVTNNILVNNSLHPHVWFTNSGDVFKNNIVFSAYKPALMNKVIAADGKWGKVIDANFFVCDSAQMHQFLKNGCDSNALNGDPLFINPLKGNYQVKDNSPALKLGFKNFSTQHFGVQKASLKAIVKTPILPIAFINLKETSAINNKATQWMGALLNQPKGDEFSAFGIGFNEGGIAFIQIEQDSKLLKWGFKAGDIVLSINNIPTKTMSQFFEIINKLSTHKNTYKFEVVRNQQRLNLLITEQLQKQNSLNPINDIKK